GNWLRSVHWRFMPGSRVFAQVRVFSVGSTYAEHNLADVSLTDNGHRATGVRGDATFQVTSHHLLHAGVYAQSGHERTRTTFFTSAAAPRQLGAFSANRTETSLYVQDHWSPADRVRVTAGARVDRIGADTLVLPRLHAVWRPGGGWMLRAAAGVQAQPPPM